MYFRIVVDASYSRLQCRYVDAKVLDLCNMLQVCVRCPPSLRSCFVPSAAVNNSSDTESVPSPRQEAKESKDNEAKPVGTSVAETNSEVPADPGNLTVQLSQEITERTSNVEEPKEDPEASTVKKEEEDEGRSCEEPNKSEIKQEEAEDSKENVAENMEEAQREATEVPQKVEKKHSRHGGKTNADSDSSATCSADEAEEQDSTDKSRYEKKQTRKNNWLCLIVSQKNDLNYIFLNDRLLLCTFIPPP